MLVELFKNQKVMLLTIGMRVGFVLNAVGPNLDNTINSLGANCTLSYMGVLYIFNISVQRIFN